MSASAETYSAPCPICGGTSYIWGQIRSQDPIRFMPDNASWARQIFTWGDHMRARCCTTCNNVQLFAHRSEE